ncbi:flagellin protein FlaA [Vibrio maritimus]|uniref:Flagellin n=1 Tax=Vibrio maritimus TaxID=990268 RepID=A0A090U268_9VIBR|nr:flagellin protein FlaA [Vibrio maritimus]
MALSMHTNYTALVTQGNLNKSNDLLGTAMERLSTGLRINSAADDAAGLTIANKLEAQTRGMSVAMRNSQDAISMMQTGEGALEELTNIAYRMSDLATQAANGTNGASEIAAMDAEYTELIAEGKRILEETSYGAGQKLFAADGFDKAGGVQFQIGASSTERLTVDVNDGLAEIANFFGATAGTNGAAATGTAAVNLTTSATAEMDSITAVLDHISGTRSQFGANINRLEHTISNLQNVSENTAAAKGRITDADYAVESANMTKQQMLMQAGTQMLATSKQMPSMAMSLLG